MLSPIQDWPSGQFAAAARDWPSGQFAAAARDWPSGQLRRWRVSLGLLPLVAHTQRLLVIRRTQLSYFE
jgi:hypothetical protein